MRVLLTNDDGIDAPGIAALERVFQTLGLECFVVAPAEPASQIGHRVTTDEALQVEERGENRFAVSGTPADCVRLAVTGSLSEPPDYVVSGINYGGNLGRHDLYISGTIAAVREAVLHGIPGTAVSHFHRADLEFSWEPAVRRTKKILEVLLDQKLGDGEFWNVNLPHVPDEAPEPRMRRCDLERAPLPVSFERDSEGLAFRYTGRYHARKTAENTDVSVCFGGDIAISQLKA